MTTQNSVNMSLVNMDPPKLKWTVNGILYNGVLIKGARLYLIEEAIPRHQILLGNMQHRWKLCPEIKYSHPLMPWIICYNSATHTKLFPIIFYINRCLFFEENKSIITRKDAIQTMMMMMMMSNLTLLRDLEQTGLELVNMKIDQGGGKKTGKSYFKIQIY